ncbi:long-chain fatty acid--CoA ligase [Dermacoccus abyssi]|uniref:Long-chain fatty acid--CoA ligase n=1 Tax=Dermacoccus abyssi TaxID=322596 RepID=A0ABX5Z854_9MICO|nr:long-chain fatty acid--CoA ligase [Dermacoccus abyssi]
MPNVAAPIWTHAARNPDHPAVRSLDKSWSYEELRSHVAAWAGALREADIERGDRIVLIAPSVPEFAAVYHGAQAAGIVVVTLNVMSTPAEIGYVLGDSGAKLVVAWHVATTAAERAGAEAGVDVWSLEPDAPVTCETPLTEPVERDASETAVLLYTSGTTGKPKGVQLTVSNLLETAEIFIRQLELEPTDAFGTGLPLFHVFGQCICMNTILVGGASLSLLSPFEPQAMVRMIRDHELTIVAGVPTMWNYLLHVAGDFGPADFANLRLAASGGASLPVEVIRAFETRFGCTILEGYGLTETTGAATYHSPFMEQRVGTTGIALPGSAVEVRGADGQHVAVDEVGEVFITGPMVMKGYWNRPEATEADLVDGWFRTGDLGALDADGYLRIVDRAKDLIIRGGYNVYPREVEEVLYEHPDVVETAVVGIPDDTYGEEVGAVVVLRPDATPDPEALRAWLKERLSAYKVPHLYRFADELPKGATGKILKRAIEWSDNEEKNDD